nr:immunoglobulin light chain junction region [Macaca mulatta]
DYYCQSYSLNTHMLF